MKRYTIKNGNANLFIGNPREIRSLFQNLDKREIAWSIFSEAPRFNKFYIYGLVVDYYDEYNEEYYAVPRMCVVNSSTALELLLDERWRK